jgi:hypothetical protein
MNAELQLAVTRSRPPRQRAHDRLDIEKIPQLAKASKMTAARPSGTTGPSVAGWLLLHPMSSWPAAPII